MEFLSGITYKKQYVSGTKQSSDSDFADSGCVFVDGSVFGSTIAEFGDSEPKENIGACEGTINKQKGVDEHSYRSVGKNVRPSRKKVGVGVSNDSCDDDVGIVQQPAIQVRDFGVSDDVSACSGSRIFRRVHFEGSTVNSDSNSQCKCADVAFPEGEGEYYLSCSDFDKGPNSPVGNGKQFVSKIVIAEDLSFEKCMPQYIGQDLVRSWDSNLFDWLCNRLYATLVACYVARATTSMEDLQVVYQELNSKSCKDRVATKYFQQEATFANLVAAMTSESSEVLTTAWTVFHEIKPMNPYLDYVLSNNIVVQGSCAVKAAKWLGKELMKYDFDLMVAGHFRYPVYYIQTLTPKCLNPEDIVSSIKKKVVHTFEKADRPEHLFANYSGTLRNIVLEYMFQKCTVEAKKIGLVDNKRGHCKVCNMTVLLHDHSKRCKPVSDKKKHSDVDWLGDSLLAMDIRILLLHFDIPKSARGTVFVKYTSNASLATYVKNRYPSATLSGTASVATEFEAKYLSSYRTDYLQYVYYALQDLYVKESKDSLADIVVKYANMVHFYQCLSILK